MLTLEYTRLLVTVAVPVLRQRHTVGIVAVTREAREVDDSLAAIRSSILGLFLGFSSIFLALFFLLRRSSSFSITRVPTGISREVVDQTCAGRHNHNGADRVNDRSILGCPSR